MSPKDYRGPQVNIRPMRAKDLGRVAQLEVSLFGAGAWSPAMLADELGGPGRWYVVLERDGLDHVGPDPVIGYAGLWFDGEQTQIMTIAVDRAYQRKGLGALLLAELIERSKKLRATGVLLEVRVDNTAAIELYRSFGFEQLSVRKRYYQPEDIDAYTMRLALDEESDSAV